MVEHNLAKVRVAGSSPVFRSLPKGLVILKNSGAFYFLPPITHPQHTAQRIFPVGSLQINIFAYLCIMKPDQLLRAILPDVLIDNFDIVSFDKSADRFDIYLDEKKVQLKEDKYNPEIIAYGFGDYRVIQDYPIRGRATYLHVRKRKWLDKSSNEIFSYDWDLSEFDGTRLNSEFVSFLKEGD